MELHRRIRPPLVENFSAGKTFEDSNQKLLKCGQSGECLCVWLSIIWLLLVCLVEGLPNFSCGPDGFKFRKKIMFGRPTKLRKALLCLASDLTYHTESGKWWPKTCPSPNPLSSLWLCISVSISIPLLSFPSPTCGAVTLNYIWWKLICTVVKLLFFNVSNSQEGIKE